MAMLFQDSVRFVTPLRQDVHYAPESILLQYNCVSHVHHVCDCYQGVAFALLTPFSIVCVHGQGDRWSRSPTRRRKHKKSSGKLSHDDRESISHDYERLDHPSGNDAASDAARRHWERHCELRQDGGQGERAPLAQTSWQLSNDQRHEGGDEGLHETACQMGQKTKA